MRHSAGAALAGMELAILALWALSLQGETGVDALTYHRMASAITQAGLAPWVVNPLSYVGIYPGSDSSGIPFLAASFALVSNNPISTTVLVYDAVLILTFGLGVFILTRQLTGRSDLAFAAVLMGSLAFGFFTSLQWSLDERSFNVALAPVLLFLAVPRGVRMSMHGPLPRLVLLALVCIVMLVSHLSFLLLFPCLFIIPLLHENLRSRTTARRKRRTSFLFFALIALSPLMLLTTLDQLGLLTQFRLEYQLESSALLSGNSPFIFVANASVFLATRVGPTNIAFAALGLLYLASRSYLAPRNIVLGSLLLTGFLGLPIVVYSKDLLTPIVVVLGTLGLAAIIRGPNRRRFAVLLLSLIVVCSGSVAFNVWNLARTSRAAETRYWTPLSVSPETQSANSWLRTESDNSECAYGNNPEVLQQVTNEPTVHFCTGLPLDVLINLGPQAVLGPLPFRVTYVGISSGNPGDWFTSPDLSRVADDFAQLPSMDYQAGRQLLLKHNVSWVVVSLVRPNDIPLFEYQGAVQSLFFTGLWTDSYPLYRSTDIAIFRLR